MIRLAALSALFFAVPAAAFDGILFRFIEDGVHGRPELPSSARVPEGAALYVVLESRGDPTRARLLYRSVQQYGPLSTTRTGELSFLRSGGLERLSDRRISVSLPLALLPGEVAVRQALEVELGGAAGEPLTGRLLRHRFDVRALLKGESAWVAIPDIPVRLVAETDPAALADLASPPAR